MSQIGRKPQVFAAQLQVSDPYRGSDYVHLASGVVYVIFAVHVITDGLQEVSHRGTVCGSSPVPNVQGAGRVGGDELDLNALTGTDPAAPVVVALLQDRRHDGQIGGAGQKNIDEPGARDLGPLDQRALRERRDDTRRQLAGIGPEYFRQHQRQVAGEVAVFGRPCALDTGRGQVVARRRAVASHAE